MRLKMLGSITLGCFLLKRKSMPKNLIFCYLLVQLLKCTVVINRPLQLIVPFEIANEPPELAETIALLKPRRDAAKTADNIRRMITN